MLFFSDLIIVYIDVFLGFFHIGSTIRVIVISAVALKFEMYIVNHVNPCYSLI